MYIDADCHVLRYEVESSYRARFLPASLHRCEMNTETSRSESSNLPWNQGSIKANLPSRSLGSVWKGSAEMCGKSLNNARQDTLSARSVRKFRSIEKWGQGSENFLERQRSWSSRLGLQCLEQASGQCEAVTASGAEHRNSHFLKSCNAPDPMVTVLYLVLWLI